MLKGRVAELWRRWRLCWRTGAPPEPLMLGNSRDWVCTRATGRVLEVSVGIGLNLPHYPAGVELTALDLDPELLAVTRAQRARDAALVQADAAALPFRSESFDTVVCTLAMCEYDDRLVVLTDMKRVLRPGGRLLLLDHAQFRWPRHGRPVTIAAEAGFVIREHQRRRLGLFERLEARKVA